MSFSGRVGNAQDLLVRGTYQNIGEIRRYLDHLILYLSSNEIAGRCKVSPLQQYDLDPPR